MNYFQILGLIFGLLALLKPFYMHIIPWDENKFIAKTYSEKRPTWILPAAILGLLLVCFTWFMELTTDVSYSILITVLFSLTAIKGLTLLFNYEKFQSFVSGMLSKDRGKKIVMIDALVGVFGLIVVIISLYLVK
ncbi:MAG: hypothetical protein AMQ22_02134 [Candidatus Methanofastidiosum methylothiophilum]|uniref:Uncharacterized protein n=1 Tax=Candidatus Methanofastidiosum methylothiophilum TaxID=1705564 RepID=A0A150INN3_9EURY|nr:MAG: hypothetical protein AMQ22_02134 [Candidatus Methanofastidiosum methylthiophilus]